MTLLIGLSIFVLACVAFICILDASARFGTVPFLVLIAYFLPTIIAGIRDFHNFWAVFVVNFFLAWTGIGWIIALVMSVWN